MLDEDVTAGDSELISLADYGRAAAGALDAGARAYFAGGAGDEITMRDNLAAWQRLAIRPRTLVGVGNRELSVTLLGRRRPHPIVIAPMAYQRLAHVDGEIATARAAAATESIMCLATFSTTTSPVVAEAVPGGSRWFQLYVFSDRGLSRELVTQAVEHGYEALVITVDLPVVGVRERELRSEVQVQLATEQMIDRVTAAGGRGLTPAEFTSLIDPDLRWSDIEQFASDCPLPVIVKGILRAEDAVIALEHGARGIVVSNHGGRQLDTVLSGADALPAIVEAVGGLADVLVDGGIRRGTDVVKALALGAQGVLVGRPVLWGLAVDGAGGAQRVLEILLSEFDCALALAGARSVEELDPSFITAAPWVAVPR
ncbi:MAG TPA: alpha-hydroxy acid oxidase [Solirubrobacteraceae bacterium]|nr:alpha-hydroxy acid oxidase [Solirubrobacteraceae bacterium]